MIDFVVIRLGLQGIKDILEIPNEYSKTYTIESSNEYSYGSIVCIRNLLSLCPHTRSQKLM